MSPAPAPEPAAPADAAGPGPLRSARAVGRNFVRTSDSTTDRKGSRAAGHTGSRTADSAADSAADSTSDHTTDRTTDRARAEALLAGWGIVARSLRCVARGDSEIWRCAAPTAGFGGGDLALRIYAAERQDAGVIDFELAWQHELAARGLFVPAPVASPDGRWRLSFDDRRDPAPKPGAVHLRSPGGAPARRHAALLQWLPGRMLYAGLRPLHLRRVGALIAQLHAASQGLRRQAGRHAQRLAYGPDLAAWAEGRRVLPAWAGAELAQIVPRAARSLQQRIAGWPRDAEHWCWIHGDLHPWNLLFHQGRAGAIDFSDGGWGFKAQDLASVLQFLRFTLPGQPGPASGFEALRSALFEGYAAAAALPPAMLEQAELLTLVRTLGTLQWMLDDWRSPDDRAWGWGFVQALPGMLEPACA